MGWDMGLLTKTQWFAVSIAGASLGLGMAAPVYAEDGQRRIEEVVVTAEKIESTVSDTSISITAFSEEAIEDFGIQGADEDFMRFGGADSRFDVRDECQVGALHAEIDGEHEDHNHERD